jgi:hypothetical protein
MAGQGQGWLAKQLGVSQPRVSKLVSEGRIPRKASYNEADVKATRAHLKASRAGANATAGQSDDAEDAIASLSKNPEKVARIKLIVERTAKIKLERELLAGGYVKKEDVDRDNAAKVYSLRNKLGELPLRSALLLGKSETELEQALRNWVNEVCDYYAGGGN